MPSLAKFNNFLRAHYLFLVFLLATSWVIVFSVLTLTTKPRIWVDESKSIELAHNFLYFKKLDIQVEPQKFSGLAPLLQSTGYPVTVPLALFFKILGYNFEVARIYMLIWMILVLFASFLLLKKLVGEKEAVLSLLLMATFASFYDSGRTVVGEIPGFLFLLTGFYFWLHRKNYYLSGLFWGLSIVSKPSVFSAVIPVAVFVFLFEGSGFLKKILKIALGMIPPALIWIFLVLENPFAKNSWVSIMNFYKNPYGLTSSSENIIQNLQNLYHSTTLIYFGFLFLLIMIARYLLREDRLASLYNFAIIYGIFAFVYYLRSPGWLRYILIAELLILFLLPSALFIIFRNLGSLFAKEKIIGIWPPSVFLLLLITIQLAHLLISPKIFYSDSVLKTKDFLKKEFPKETIGVLNSLNVGIFIEPARKFQIVEMLGIPVLGKNPLFLSKPPEVIVSSAEGKFLKEGEPVIKEKYGLYETVDDYVIYKLR